MGSPRIIVDDARFAVIVGVMKCGGSGVGMGVATVVGIVVWLSGKFAALMPKDEYSRRHDDLERRVRDMEQWRAKFNGPKP